MGEKNRLISDEMVRAVQTAAEALAERPDSYRIQRLREAIATSQAELAELEARDQERRKQAEAQLLDAAGWRESVGWVHELFGPKSRSEAVRLSLAFAALSTGPFEHD